MGAKKIWFSGVKGHGGLFLRAGTNCTPTSKMRKRFMVHWVGRNIRIHYSKLRCTFIIAVKDISWKCIFCSVCWYMDCHKMNAVVLSVYSVTGPGSLDSCFVKQKLCTTDELTGLRDLCRDTPSRKNKGFPVTRIFPPTYTCCVGFLCLLLFTWCC